MNFKFFAGVAQALDLSGSTYRRTRLRSEEDIDSRVREKFADDHVEVRAENHVEIHVEDHMEVRDDSLGDLEPPHRAIAVSSPDLPPALRYARSDLGMFALRAAIARGIDRVHSRFDGDAYVAVYDVVGGETLIVRGEVDEVTLIGTETPTAQSILRVEEVAAADEGGEE
ncbi:hypothetical protein [Amycolatopsis lexingtonensis]|uniref:hypothetical protein n=1 Tax=Amycolatopsis lexingtonensis TaxID=218822 RepID=UPI003F72659C